MYRLALIFILSTSSLLHGSVGLFGDAFNLVPTEKSVHSELSSESFFSRPYDHPLSWVLRSSMDFLSRRELFSTSQSWIHSFDKDAKNLAQFTFAFDDIASSILSHSKSFDHIVVSAPILGFCSYLKVSRPSGYLNWLKGLLSKLKQSYRGKVTVIPPASIYGWMLNQTDSLSEKIKKVSQISITRLKSLTGIYSCLPLVEWMRADRLGEGIREAATLLRKDQESFKEWFGKQLDEQRFQLLEEFLNAGLSESHFSEDLIHLNKGGHDYLGKRLASFLIH